MREREREQMKTERGKRDSVNRSKLGGPRERERERITTPSKGETLSK